MPLMLIHPRTADVFMAKKGDGAIARALILDGYNPIGPKGQAAAKIIRERAQPTPGETDMRTYFKPADEREHRLGNAGHDVTDWCINCRSPFAEHHNGQCPPDENEEVEREEGAD